MIAEARLPLTAAMLGILASLTACSGIKYNSDFDPQVDFQAYRSYVWAQPGENAGTDPRGVSQLIERRIMAAIDDQLAAEGYEKATSGTPDFIVNFIVTTQQKVDYTTYYSGWGYYGWYGGGMGGAYTQATEWTEGTLLVDIFDAKSKELSWRGWAQGTVDPSASPERRDQRVRQVVTKLFERFPPN
ncbi:MAG: DUF4136 domain-containing protein [Gemmatimonadota bacterium]|nr:MAG: DUF4136 domain-containing protein [Gemmatimonadota bacterium]